MAKGWNLMEVILRVENLSKKIGKRVIVENINFQVNEGEVFGFLGPNGAGKTTTIRMLVGLIKPTTGTINICGFNLQHNFRQAAKCFGSIVENPAFYPYLTGLENLEQFARLLGDVNGKEIHELSEMLKIKNALKDKVKTYSLGMKQRLGIVQALLGKPRLLILDEPTNGLDPFGIKELREFIHYLAREKKISLFISSHILSEIERIADRVMFINNGKIIDTVEIDKDLIREHVSPLEELFFNYTEVKK